MNCAELPQQGCSCTWQLQNSDMFKETLHDDTNTFLEFLGFPVAQRLKRLPEMRETWVRSLGCGRPGFDPWDGKIPWRRKWQPTPVFLPGESHGRRSLVGYCPQGHKESDTTE